ncbi:hypothetical protein B5807_01573 [Epicoccum nigrum]|uniref:Uncharacterized protein n=1 Tax=Epicoccum nigrum TaxID=105696 RepID=A0A1Y2ME02_EPING|nr:hypothetical protein B5807_01573 [Epicoccum nigrum]
MVRTVVTADSKVASNLKRKSIFLCTETPRDILKVTQTINIEKSNRVPIHPPTHSNHLTISTVPSPCNTSTPLSNKLARHLRNRRQIPNPARNTLHVNAPKHAALASSVPSIPITPIIPARMSTPSVPSPGPTASHLWQIHAELACELVQHPAANERHDDGEEDLVRMALGVVHQVAPQLAQLAVQRLQVAVARRARVT